MKRIGFFFIIITYAIFFSCKQSKEVTPLAGFTPYISACTGGIVDKNATIIIEFTEEQSNEIIGKTFDAKWFSFSPSLNGNAHWVNSRTLEFIPQEDALKQGTVYNASFALGKFMKVDKKFSEFNFSFKVRESDFKITASLLEIQPDETITIRGELSLADVISVETAQKLITAKIAGKNMDIVFEEQNESDKFKFSVIGITKENQTKKLNIHVNGAPAKINKEETVAIEIPAKDVFQLCLHEMSCSPDYSINLAFSDIISETQDLKGLIVVKNLKNYTLERIANNIVIHFSGPSDWTNLEVTIDQGLKNNKEKSLGETKTLTFSFDRLKPAVELLTSGMIIPDEGRIILPFRAVSLRAVDLRIIRIFENNIFTFLQDNSLNATSTNQLRRAGRMIYKETLKLDNDLSDWKNYSLDLTGIIKQRPRDIYRIELSFKQNYAYGCDDANLPDVALENAVDLERLNTINNFNEEDMRYWDTPDNYYYENYDINADWSQYDWRQRDNPCHPTYYMQNNHRAGTNVFVSNIGLIAKMNSNNTIWVTASDIRDAKPVPHAEITAYNYQHQPLGTARTDNSGFAVLELQSKPFAILASSGNQTACLRLVDGEENMLSRFDVGGVDITKGLKGFIYGERGVWRPGDTLHVAFMLEDEGNKIPDNHPVSFEVFNPRGQFYRKIISTEGLDGLYTFDLPTKLEDPTGVWNAYIKIGGATFHKSLRIEAIKPNRLKIKLEMPDIIDGSKTVVPIGIQSSWLTGAMASELNATVDLTLSKSNAQFKGYEKYVFNNPVYGFTSGLSEVYNTKLDSDGKALIDFKIPKAENAPGMLKADFICRVFEPGGDASIYAQSLPFSPFPAYIGINFNVESVDSYLFTDQNYEFEIVTLSSEGKLVNRNDLEYNIYRIGWSWWWENKGEQFDSYINNSNYKPLFEGKLNTVNGKGRIKFRIDYPEWGRYFIYVKDPVGGHGTGGTVLVDWPEWRGRSNKQDPDGVKMLAFAMDNENYEAGNDVTVTIPAVASGGRALVALENGSEVIRREWVDLNSGQDTKYTFKATNKMTPNVYIHISLLQPHKAATDLPIRMYGVKPVFVSDQQTILDPVITMPDVLKPESAFEVKVKEKSRKSMTYTLAIVDDGLLDLTNFKTPNPWNTFYAREALGIRTWDLYDNVMGAYTGRLGSMFSIGGDGELLKSPTKANRFKPVVLFLGPFSLKAGEEKKHSLQLPAYAGSLRAMIVACHEGAYGNTEKTVAVRSPLMILSSLPRILSTDETINLPVNVFVSEHNLKKVTVKIETEGKLKPTGDNIQSIDFASTGDQLVYFPMKTGNKTGKEKVVITSTAGDQTFKETVEIEIRNPNPPVLTFRNRLLGKGESVEYEYETDKEYDDNRVTVEMSRIPNVDLRGKLDYLGGYYHYCSEQLVSRALPLLYVSDLKYVDENEKKIINQNIFDAINNLYMRQSLNGGFIYWPGSNTVDEWITSYVGSFLAVAKERGFVVNSSVMDKWIKYQQNKAKNWRKQVEDNQSQSDYIQAYRLYTLAQAGSPDLGAMNRLREIKDMSIQARWRLAAAYSTCGKNDVANELIFNTSRSILPYSANYSTFGSSDKDEAMILETLVLMNKEEEAFKQAQKVAETLANVNNYSVQHFAAAISAMGQLASKSSGKLDFQYTVNGMTEKISDAQKALYQKDIPLNSASGKVKIVNGREGVLYTGFSTKSRPLTDNNPEMNNNIKLDVSYTDLKGDVINIDNLKQGSDLYAVIRVSNISGRSNYRNMALTQIVPSGWEIINRNMFGSGNLEKSADESFTYRDIRDDRILTYFDLPAGTSREFKISLQASYIGDFVLPAILCEAMYEPAAYARTKARRVKVIR
jgi:uncharacterized protein YfaS (alpha-2-macroglobulin family)